MPANQPPSGVPDLIRQLLADDPARPRVTYYGPNFERVEFSARTLDRWISKTANLLVDELDAEPGARIGLALPAHWRSVVWLLATWTVGAHAVVYDEQWSPGERLLVLVTDRPTTPPPGTQESVLVVQPLPALATRFAGEVPTGAIDAASEVRLQPDHFPGSRGPAPFDPAFSSAATEKPVEYGELLGRALAAAPPDGPTGTGQPVRLLTGAPPAAALASYLGPLAVGGSIVIHHDLASLDPAALDHLREQEHVTSTD